MRRCISGVPILPTVRGRRGGRLKRNGHIQLGPKPLLLQMDLAGVERVVLVPPSWEGERNDLALAAAATYPDRFGVMGRLSLTDPASRDLVPRWLDQPGMLGMRFTFHNRFNRHLLTNGSADWLWKAAESERIPLMVLVPGQLDVLGRLAAEHPGLKFVIDHVGHQPAAQRCERLGRTSESVRSREAAKRRREGERTAPLVAGAVIRSQTCTTTFGGCSTPSARGEPSGART